MEPAPSYRESNRARLREALIAAARELTVAQGWHAVRMVDVAGAAGVSRQTVYNEFDGRSGLAEALAVSEVERFVERLRAELACHGGDVGVATYAAILLTLDEAARNPLVRAVLTSGRGGAEGLLPYLTTRSDVVLTAAGRMLTEWVGTRRPGLGPEAVALAVDAVIRLTVSHIMLPLDTPAGTAGRLSGTFLRLLR